MSATVKVITYFVLSILSIMLTAFTLSTLWGWFIVPLGVNAIGAAHAFGLSTIVMFFKLRGRKKFLNSVLVEKDEKREWCEHFALPFIALLIGWITTLFM